MKKQQLMNGYIKGVIFIKQAYISFKKFLLNIFWCYMKQDMCFPIDLVFAHFTNAKIRVTKAFLKLIYYLTNVTILI